MTKDPKEPTSFCPTNKEEWRQWLQQNHDKEKGVWLIYHKKATNKPTITWSEAVDEALCFGWIDSTKRPLENGQFQQFFSKRKPKSIWSKINKDKIAALTVQGRMSPAGLAAVTTAKQNGSWNLLDEVETLAIPDDLSNALAAQPGATACFESWSKSVRKNMLVRLVLAKRPETRLKRITEIVGFAARGEQPV